MNKLLNYSTLQRHFDNASFVVNTQQQIAKDFAKFNLYFPEHFAKDALDMLTITTYIGERIAELMKEGETRLLQLLYTIDLPEKDFLAITTHPNFIAEISRLILVREAHKVYLRSTY